MANIIPIEKNTLSSEFFDNINKNFEELNYVRELFLLILKFRQLEKRIFHIAVIILRLLGIPLIGLINI